jgi:peptidoglycan hydrolase CwlO-like protein
VILSLSLLGTSALPSRANELGDAVQQQKDITNQTNQVRGQLNQLTYTADKIKTQMAQLETHIASAQLLLGQKQAAYAEAQKLVLSAQKELDLKQKELEERRVALGKRAKGIYESGQVSYLELLFQAADLGDFITRMEYFTKLVSNDRQLLLDIQTQKEQITQKALELQSRRDHAAQLQVQAASVKTDLDKAKSQQRIALDQNQKAQQAAFDYVDRLESEANALGDKIRKMQAAQAARRGGVSGSISTWPVPGFYEISDPFGLEDSPHNPATKFAFRNGYCCSGGDADFRSGSWGRHHGWLEYGLW